MGGGRLGFAQHIREARALQIRPVLRSIFLATVLVSPAQTAFAQSDAGSYLAGRQASISNDFTAAADYFSRAIAADPSNVLLMENAALASISAGKLDRAASISRRLVSIGQTSQIASMALLSDGIRREK